MRLFWQSVVFCTIALWADSALAQRRPIADDTLGGERSIVTPAADIRGRPGDRISGGARRGDNLFHSFREFGIDPGRSVYFEDPGVRNILSRVTGGNPSEIFGRLGVLGNANLFLINPSGIVFGTGASLDVGGSFVGTTANGIQFGNQGFFNVSEPNAPTLLTVQPSAFLFNQIAVQPINSIENRGALRVPENESLLLVGGNVSPTATATGGILINGGFLSVPDGRIELAGVSAPGVIGLDIVDSQLRLQFSNNIARSDIALTNGANVNASGNSGGSIQVYGRAVTIGAASRIQSNTLGAGTGKGINVNASELVQMSDTTADRISGLAAQLDVDGTGTAGDITIQTRRLLIQGGAQVSTGVFGTGAGGDLNVIATDSIEITDVLNNGLPSGLFTEAVEGSSGNSGNLIIQTRQLRLLNGAEISSANFSNGAGGNIALVATDSVEVSGFRGRFFSNLGASAFGEGNAGDLTIQTGQLIIKNGGVIAASTFGGGTGGTLRIDTRQLLMQNGAGLGATTRGEGDGGDLIISASDSVQIVGGRNLSILTVSSESRDNTGGDAGDLSINTGRLLLQDGAQVTAATLGGGEGGNLIVVASDSVQVSGTPSIEGTPTGLFASTRGTGDAGDLLINTGQLQVQDGATVSVNSAGSSRAGNLRINARAISLNNRAKITAATEAGLGGNIELQISDFLRLRNNSVISASAETGRSGSLRVDADSIQLRDRSGLFVESTKGGTAGDLAIDTDQLTVRDRAQVSVSSTGLGQAGDLNVTARDILLDDRARLRADTESGGGSNVKLSVLDILRLLNNSEISASTQSGQGGSLILNDLGRLQVSDSRISASAHTGRAGNVRISASDSMQLQDGSQLSVEARRTGTAGDLQLTTGRLSVDRSQITVSNPNGKAGSLGITADTVQLNRGRLRADIGGSASGANIDLRLGGTGLQMQNGSRVSAIAADNARGGNVTVNAPDGFVIASPEDNDIRASASQGQGGDIQISAQGIFGLEERRSIAGNGTNDIDASSNFGTAGTVVINRLDPDPTQGLVQLPIAPIDASNQIAQRCPINGDVAGEFVITGRGGVPSNPAEILGGETVLTDLAEIEGDGQGNLGAKEETSDRTAVSSSAKTEIVEAQGWVVGADGKVRLTTDNPAVEPHRPPIAPVLCPSS